MSETTNESQRPGRRFERSDRSGRSTLFRPRALASHEALKRSFAEAKEAAAKGSPENEISGVSEIKVEENRAFRPSWLMIGVGLAVVVIVAAAASTGAYFIGKDRGRAIERAAHERGVALFSPEQAELLNAALAKLRAGNSADAIKMLSDLKQQGGNLPSISYLLALAALQDGDARLAMTEAEKSISLKERVSDSLALLAVLETQKANDRTQVAMVDPRRRAEALLREAMAVDPANPYPHFELATLLRYQGNRQEALKEIEAAKARLNPMDSHLVMDITSRLLRLESLAAADLPPQEPSTNDPRELLPAAYAAMKRGDFDHAADLLRKTQTVMDRELFAYLINDPAMRRFAKEPKLAEFYSEK